VATEGKRRTGVSKRRKLKIGLATLVLLVFAGWMLIDSGSPFGRYQIKKTTLEWTCLAPFPDTAKFSKIVTTGSMFTRSFEIVFEDDATVIRKWLGASPVSSLGNIKSDIHMQTDEIELFTTKPTFYMIDTCVKIAAATLNVSADGTTVSIYVAWS